MEEAEGKEMEVPEERSSAKENQAAEGGHGEEGSGYVCCMYPLMAS